MQPAHQRIIAACSPYSSTSGAERAANIRTALKSNPTLTVQQLVQAANDNGGRDNISAMLIRVAQPYGVPRGWFARFKALFR